MDPEHQAVPSQHWKILFLRGRRDEHIFMHDLSSAERIALRSFLLKKCAEFEVAFHAAARNHGYIGLVRNLTQPSFQEWSPGWVVHWHIRTRQHPPATAPYKLEDFVLQVEMLERLT
jgi:hypothetical protein